jgi:hypothetical protein
MDKPDMKQAGDCIKGLKDMLEFSENFSTTDCFYLKSAISILKDFAEGRLVESEYEDLTAAYMAGFERGKSSVKVMSQKEIVPRLSGKIPRMGRGNLIKIIQRYTDKSCCVTCSKCSAGIADAILGKKE